MKAGITDGKGNVWLEDVPMPSPGEYECLCKILACATCTGTDQKHIHNKVPWEQNYPGLLGHESVGRVVSVGAKVRNYEEGDLVLRAIAAYPGETLGGYHSMWGGFSEYGLVTDAAALREDDPEVTPNNFTRFQQALSPTPRISPADATMLITLKETASYVADVGVRLYSSVVILGAGSVAISMCRFAKIFGACPVIVAARRDEPLLYARDRIGADFVVNVTSIPLLAAAHGLTDGSGVDFLIDTTGDAEFVQSALGVLKDSGRAALYALYESSDTVENVIDADRLVTARTGEDLAHRYLWDCVRLGLVTLEDFYSHRLPFSQFAEGFAMVGDKRAFKVVFEMEEEA